MATELELFGDKAAIPAHIQKFFDKSEGNIEPQISVPSLSYGGKTWAITTGGEKKPLMRRDEEGDESPVAIMRVVILDYAKERGRAYYEGAYDPDATGSPVCWSVDGVQPDNTVSAKQAATCAKCPMAAKGSRTTPDGKSVTACSQHRMLALVPTQKMDMDPLRMKIAITSDYDKQSPEHAKQGWYAFRQLIDFLFTNGANDTGAFSIKMKFDPDTAYPKVLFHTDRWLSDDELEQVSDIREKHDLSALLRGGRPVPEADALPSPDAIAPAADAVQDDDDDGDFVMPAEVEKPKPEEKKAAAPKPVLVEDDDDGIIDLEAVETSGEKAKSTDKSEDDAIPDDVAALLEDWDDED